MINQRSVATCVILSIVTCGLYGIWWEYKLGNRLQKNGPVKGGRDRCGKHLYARIHPAGGARRSL